MNIQYKMRAARDHYQSLALSSRLEATGPHGLVSVLYEELIRSIDVMSVGISRRKNLAEEPHSDRARSILTALDASLDFERGGAVADQLSSVYRAMQGQLRRSIAANDAAMLAQLREGVSAIAESWNRIVR
jgi:flagellar protein FliS